MNNIEQYIQEKLKISSKSKVNRYQYHPETKKELKELINKLIEDRGLNANLNDIDVSNMKDMTSLFYNSDFNGDISEWDVSNVEYMNSMFADSKFNGDISNWDVSNVEHMDHMFADSKFNGDISKWDVSNVFDLNVLDIEIFKNCPLEKNPPKWYKFKSFRKNPLK